MSILTGLQLLGFDILMQYYSKLRDHMRNCYLFEDSGIVTFKDRRFISDKYNAELILTRLANHLLCGKTNLFYEMLGIIQSVPYHIGHDLVAEIQLVLKQNGMKCSCNYNECLYNTYIIISKRVLYMHTVKVHFSPSLDGYSMQ